MDKILNIDDDILVKECSKGEGLKLTEIIGMEVINKYGTIKGVVEDILIKRMIIL